MPGVGLATSEGRVAFGDFSEEDENGFSFDSEKLGLYQLLPLLLQPARARIGSTISAHRADEIRMA
ncbi:MAG: hypothetical protein A2V98_16235 [Planctomycetes bacterium RBG_16_64_12]|nr:MAG: hypothetical protein A2V98_16235 [Planctomycetes bacterium RBG_16_64_12]